MTFADIVASGRSTMALDSIDLTNKPWTKKILEHNTELTGNKHRDG
jgi:hypothetical protein